MFWTGNTTAVDWEWLWVLRAISTWTDLEVRALALFSHEIWSAQLRWDEKTRFSKKKCPKSFQKFFKTFQQISRTFHVFVKQLNFSDFAAGAPYAGEEGRGIVYIYMGGKNGVVAKATQAIQARDIDVHLNTFGFSLAGGTDLDGNMYPGKKCLAFHSTCLLA